MKLITEYLDSDITVKIDESTGPKKLFIEGIFMQASKKNRNGRIYPKNVMENAVKRYYDEFVITGRAVGELNHPESPAIDYNNVSHRIVDLRMEGDNVFGKALILNTHSGNIVRGLLEGGVKIGVSSRGLGTILKKADGDFVGENFLLSTVDIVHDPSAPDAFVNGIMEGADWVISDNGIVTNLINKSDITEKTMLHTLEAFTSFINKL